MSANNQPVPQTLQLIPRQALLRALGVSGPTLWRWQRQDSFPKPVYVTTRPAWRVSDIEAWLAQRPRTRTDASSPAA